VSFLFDLHVHSQISACSTLPIRDILKRSRSLGLHGVCITDHNSLQARNHVREGIQDDGLCVVIGQECSTQEGHFLVFGAAKKLPSFMPARDMLRMVQDMGAVAVAAHPFRVMQEIDERLAEAGLIEYAEGINGGNTSQENAMAKAWQQKYQVHLTGGSDAHHLSDLGRAVTRFFEPIHSVDELIKALNSKRFEPCYNPFSGSYRHWLEALRLLSWR